jgi:hypothetical protein
LLETYPIKVYKSSPFLLVNSPIFCGPDPTIPAFLPSSLGLSPAHIYKILNTPFA